jgi:hypothetical protein
MFGYLCIIVDAFAYAVYITLYRHVYKFTQWERRSLIKFIRCLLGAFSLLVQENEILKLIWLSKMVQLINDGADQWWSCWQKYVRWSFRIFQFVVWENAILKLCRWSKIRLLFDWKIIFVVLRKQRFRMINYEADQWWTRWKNMFVDQLEYFNWSFEKTKL